MYRGHDGVNAWKKSKPPNKIQGKYRIVLTKIIQQNVIAKSSLGRSFNIASLSAIRVGTCICESSHSIITITLYIHTYAILYVYQRKLKMLKVRFHVIATIKRARKFVTTIQRRGT